MTARFRKLFDDLAETFWLVPALIVFAGALKAQWPLWRLTEAELSRAGCSKAGYTTAEQLARTCLVRSHLPRSALLVQYSHYDRSSVVAAGQMGPRLLRILPRIARSVDAGRISRDVFLLFIVLHSVRNQ